MNYGVLNKPKAPGATRRVWEIADALTEEAGRLARRKEVIDAYVAEGGNANTASTQFHYWKVAQEAEAETDATPPRDVAPMRLRVEADGRLVLPAEVVRALQVDDDGLVAVRVDDGECRLVAAVDAAKRVQGLLAHLKRPGESVVDGFLAERRAAWGDE